LGSFVKRLRVWGWDWGKELERSQFLEILDGGE